MGEQRTVGVGGVDLDLTTLVGALDLDLRDLGRALEVERDIDWRGLGARGVVRGPFLTRVTIGEGSSLRGGKATAGLVSWVGV